MIAGTSIIALAPVSACSTLPHRQGVSLRDIEAAPSSTLPAIQRWLVADPAALESLCAPIGRRMCLVQVRSPADWDAFKRAVGDSAMSPSMGRGILIAIGSRAGEPLDGGWPVHIDDLRISDGAGLLTATFEGGNYLPDGSTYLEGVFVEDLAAVLAIEINGERYYPD